MQLIKLENNIMNNLITNKLGLLVIVLTFLWVTADFNSRLTTSTNLQDKNTLIGSVTPLPLPNLSRESVLSLAMAYKKYQTDNDVKVPVKSVGMSEQQQAEQKGELNSLFIGDNKLNLKAIINRNAVKHNSATKSKNLVALILIKNLVSAKSEIKQFSHNAQVQGFVLTIDKNTQVNFTKQLETGEQKVTLTMYKKGTGT